MKAAITCVAGYVPDNVLTNDDLSKMVDTSDEWIKTRTGISERHILKDPTKALQTWELKLLRLFARKEELILLK